MKVVFKDTNDNIIPTGYKNISCITIKELIDAKKLLECEYGEKLEIYIISEENKSTKIKGRVLKKEDYKWKK